MDSKCPNGGIPCSEIKCPACGAGFSVDHGSHLQFQCGSYVWENKREEVSTPGYRCMASQLATSQAEVARLKEDADKIAPMIARLSNERVEATQEVAGLKAQIKEALTVMGPSRPSCCQGCEYEWDEALKILRAVTVNRRGTT